MNPRLRHVIHSNVKLKAPLESISYKWAFDPDICPIALDQWDANVGNGPLAPSNRGRHQPGSC
ncbi:hypothetical protein CHELA40_12442 [Chelatococcus asaccharovorans]|nr:hypothetical protein CHELA40_12442 [Chelatococcus asaccharovorans]CAH1682654.1 hypothetical protein CHELA17_63166 [Chelatococcus asaccharovorans]